MVGNEILEQIGHRQVLEVAIALDAHRVAQHPEAGGHIAGEVHLASGVAQHAELCRGGVAQQRALLLGELATQPQLVLRHAVGDNGRNWLQAIRQDGARDGVDDLGVTSHLMGTIERKTEFGVLVEALEHRHAHGVAQPPVAGRLVGASQIQIGVVKEGRILIASTVHKLVLAVLEVEGPDETRHGHIGAVDDGIGDAVAAIAVETHLVALVEPQLAALKVAVGCTQQGGDALVVHAGLAALHLGRVGDVTVIGDAAALLGGVVVVVEEGLHLVAVAHV